MADTTKAHTNTEILNQMLEDLAGDELSEFDHYDVDADIEAFNDTDHFLEIDQYH